MRTIAKNHPTRKNTTVLHHIPAGFDQVYEDLMNYNETFSFILEMRSTMNKYGKLSDRQWGAIAKCLAPKPVVDPLQVLVEQCNIPITVSASSARFIAKTHSWTFNPRTLIVTQIKSKNRGGFMVRVKIDWTGNVSECRCCGKALSDWRSQATGVGPYCVKKTGIAYVRNQADVARFQKEMEALAAKIGEVEVMIKNWGIETGMSDLESAVATSTPVTLAPPAPAPAPVVEQSCPRIPIGHFQWDPSNGLLVSRREDSEKYINLDDLPEMVQVYNDETKRAINFQRRMRESQYLRYKSTNPDFALEVIFE